AGSDGRVYIGDGSNLYAVAATDGTVLSTVPTLGFVESAAVVANGVVYLGTDNGDLSAFDAVSGASLWSAFPGGGGLHRSAAVVNGMVYAGGTDGNLSACHLGPSGQTPTSPPIA